MKRPNTNFNLPLLALLPKKIKFDILKYVSIEDIFAVAEVSKASRAFIVSEYDLLSCLIRDFGPHLGYHHANTSSLDIRHDYMMSHFKGEKVKGYLRGAGRPDYEKASPVLKFMLGPDIRESKDIKQPWKLWYTIRYGVNAYRELSFETCLSEFKVQKMEQMARNDMMFARRKRLRLDLADVDQHEFDDKGAEPDLKPRSDQKVDQISDSSSDNFGDAAEQKSSNNEQESEDTYECPRDRFNNLIDHYDKKLTVMEPAESHQESAVQSSGNDDRLRPKCSDEVYFTTPEHKHTHTALRNVRKESGLTILAADAERVLSTSLVKVVRMPLSTTYENLELFEEDISCDGITSAERQFPNLQTSACLDEDGNSSECDPEEFLLLSLASNVPSKQKPALKEV